MKKLKRLMSIVMAAAVILGGSAMINSSKAFAEWTHVGVSVGGSGSNYITSDPAMWYDPAVDSGMNVTVEMHNASGSDNYTEAYYKRINYSVKNVSTGVIVTQGTLYYSVPTNYLKQRVSYSISGLTKGYYRLTLDAPVNGDGEGYIEKY